MLSELKDFFSKNVVKKKKLKREIFELSKRHVPRTYGVEKLAEIHHFLQLENDFIRENLSILIEFGIPSNAVRRLEKIIPANLSEDEVIEFIKKNRSNMKEYLLPYEMERLEQCI